MVKVVPYPEKPGTLGFGGSSLIFRDTLQTDNKEINPYTKIKKYIYLERFLFRLGNIAYFTQDTLYHR